MNALLISIEPILKLVNNAALLLAFGVLYDAVVRIKEPLTWVQKIVYGLLTGLIGIGLMMNHWHMAPGIIFDTRTILLTISGLFFGVIPTGIAAAIMAIFRWLQGGIGRIMGVMTIISASAIGIGWRFYLRKAQKAITVYQLLIMGYATHITMMLCTWFIPPEFRKEVQLSIVLPVMTLYPFATVLLGYVFLRHRDREKHADDLRIRQQHLLESEQKLAEIANQATPIWMSGLDMGCYWFNQSWLDFTGRTMEQEKGNGWTEGVHPEDLERCLNTYTDNFLARKPFFMDYRIRRYDGEYRWVVDNGYPRYNTDGEFIGYLGSCVDTTEQKLTQVAIRESYELLEQRVSERTAQLKAANDELESFAYSVAHDLRAPLRSLDGFSKFLLADYYDRLDDEGKRLLTIIRSSAQHMDELIKDLLALSRLAKTEMVIQSVEMDQLVNKVISKLLSEEDRTIYQVQVTRPLPLCHCDPNLMEHVWSNLISNAFKFTQPTPVKQITISGSNEAHRIVYSIKDTGVGFDPKYKDRIFQVFQRLHKAEDFEGTGVGLAIVQRIIHKHGGEVWADGAIDQGATFSFSLPINDEVIYGQTD